MGLTTKGIIGATTAVTLEESARRVQAMHDAAKRVNHDILVLCHGGPIAEPADAQYILDHTEGIVGFYGASSMERLPVEPAITERIREFGRLKFRDSRQATACGVSCAHHCDRRSPPSTSLNLPPEFRKCPASRSSIVRSAAETKPWRSAGARHRPIGRVRPCTRRHNFDL